MSVIGAIIVGVLAALAVTFLSDLISEEIRNRLDRLPRALMRLAARRLPDDVREDLRDDWLAELEIFLHGCEALPVTRLIRGTGFALGLVRAARAIGRDLSGLPAPTEPFWSVTVADVNRPAMARVYDYLLGGKDNFAADRVVGDRIKQALPEIRIGVEAQRAVLRRAVRFLTAEAGIRQFVDIGAGLPTSGNVHEVAQAIHPESRVVYVDHDPIVLAHARALLTRDDRTMVIDGDLLRPAEIFADPALSSHLDLSQPVGLLLCGILHHVTDDEDPARLVARLCEALPSGSYVFIHHLAEGDDPNGVRAEAALQDGLGRGRFRSVAEIRRIFGGLELVEPGLVRVPEWRPDLGGPSGEDHPVLRLAVAGLGRV